MDQKQRVDQLKLYNEAYREGSPLISDAEYDRLVEELRAAAPGHPYLNAVEPENLNGKTKVRHPRLMLSTEKAYSKSEIERWIERVHKEAAQIGENNLLFKAMAKLDGVSGRNETGVFATRGDGRFGQDISDAWAKGVVPIGGLDQGLGEIVIDKKFFENNLSDRCNHPRNVVAGMLGADVLNESIQSALKAGAVHFVTYASLYAWQGQGDDLLANVDEICEQIREQCSYHMDGFVFEVTNAAVKEHMGATSHHYRWQIAYKQKGETAFCNVLDVVWQVGRTGKVTPVVEIEPVVLSGATIRRVTAHHAGMVLKHKIGPLAMIQIIRSGEVIPKIEAILEEASVVTVPEACPVCREKLCWENDFLICTNSGCRAQVEQTIEHWFKTLGNADWFGPKAIEKIVGCGVKTIEGIYALGEADFVKMGFGPGQSKNLSEALLLTRTSQIEDWRFLAAFGVFDLGRGDARKILSHFCLEALLDVSAGQIQQIHGFAEKSSQSIAQGLKSLAPTITKMLALGFTLERTGAAAKDKGLQPAGPFAGKTLVFTGKMSGNREDMQNEARKLGAIVGSSVTGKTNFLICGDSVGATKIEKAQKLGVQVISEEKYRQMLAS